MTTRRTLFRALAALATLPLFGKAAAVEAAPDPKALYADEKTIAVFDALVAGDKARTECLMRDGEFERFSDSTWRCELGSDTIYVDASGNRYLAHWHLITPPSLPAPDGSSPLGAWHLPMCPRRG